MNCHEAIDVMDDAIEGRLDAERRAGFNEHMVECRACGTYLEHLRMVRVALQLQRDDAVVHPRRDELIRTFEKEFEQDS
jgi:anti-sigma factor RsiW